ncbi:MAG: PEP-CTERM sorting domain-containing protein [Opitutales bacterium]|nr:PEP-CTERM sorting domain-containing protein [Opitutales bacterium]
MNKPSTALLALAFGLPAAASAGPVISLNLIPNDTGGAYNLQAEDVAGVEARANWNNAVATASNYGTVSASNLVNDLGAATGADFSYFVTGSGQGRGGSFFTAGTAPEATPDDLMMKASLGTFDAGGITNYRITGLPTDFTGPGYRVYAYWGGKSAEFGPDDTIRDTYSITAAGDPGDGATFVMGYTGSGADSHWDGTYALSTITSQDDFEASDLGQYNYILFEGLSADSFTISVTQGAERRHGQLSGLQVVAIPEPSTYAALFGAFALGWILLRRRARR